MREILFRGKNIDSGEWVDGCYFRTLSNDEHIHCIISINNFKKLWGKRFKALGRAVEVDGKTVGQYIGLTDKNGKKIFEGDILHLPHYLGVHYAQIAFICERFCLVDAHGDFLVDSHWIEHNIIVSSEIVGNIYDNPELLKGD